MVRINPRYYQQAVYGRGIFDAVKNIFGGVGRVVSSLFGSAKDKFGDVLRDAGPQLGSILADTASGSFKQIAKGGDPLEVLKRRGMEGLYSGYETLRPGVQKSGKQLLQQAKKAVEQEELQQGLKQIVRRGRASAVETLGEAPVSVAQNVAQTSVSSLLSKLMDKQSLRGRGIAQL